METGFGGKYSSLIFQLLILQHVLLSSTGVLSQKTQCGLYGAPPCDFVPVPRGATPPCAGIGRTYCEHVPNYPKTQIRSVIRKLQYDVQVHLVDEVPVEFSDMTMKPDTKYGTPSSSGGGAGKGGKGGGAGKDGKGSGSGKFPHPPSPTYGVPGQVPGSPSGIFPNQFEFQKPPSPPSPTYGVPPSNSYIPPPSPVNSQKNFQVNTEYLPPPNRGGSKEGSGYVYNRPSEGLQSAKIQAREGDASTESKSSESEETAKKVHLTTSSPSEAPEFFFSEQFERLAGTTTPTTSSPLPTSPSTNSPLITSSQLVLEQHVFHPQEQPFFPNSPPAPFSTASYQEQRQRERQRQSLEFEPLPTLATEPQPPAVDARDYYRYNSPPPQTDFNQADWFRRISRSANQSEVIEEEEEKFGEGPPAPVNATFIQELRQKHETLRILFGGSSREDLDEDLIINFEAARALGGNRTSRTKRQSLNKHVLCETTSQYIEPQAALTRDGEWKFIVNQVESARQLVKVEYCATETCSNLCILPNGYTSRCEQKYVQKRLVTLDPSGNSIYTDTFWFPSCCVCTITDNN